MCAANSDSGQVANGSEKGAMWEAISGQKGDQVHSWTHISSFAGELRRLGPFRTGTLQLGRARLCKTARASSLHHRRSSRGFQRSRRRDILPSAATD
jgi:hypothetical protein